LAAARRIRVAGRSFDRRGNRPHRIARAISKTTSKITRATPMRHGELRESQQEGALFGRGSADNGNRLNDESNRSPIALPLKIWKGNIVFAQCFSIFNRCASFPQYAHNPDSLRALIKQRKITTGVMGGSPLAKFYDFLLKEKHHDYAVRSAVPPSRFSR
jgi:hypothetical protein